MHPVTQVHILNFPSFFGGLSLRPRRPFQVLSLGTPFLYIFVGTFIEAGMNWNDSGMNWISLPYGKGIH